jgi:hypothetical protein
LSQPSENRWRREEREKRKRKRKKERKKKGKKNGNRKERESSLKRELTSLNVLPLYIFFFYSF